MFKTLQDVALLFEPDYSKRLRAQLLMVTGVFKTDYTLPVVNLLSPWTWSKLWSNCDDFIESIDYAVDRPTIMLAYFIDPSKAVDGVSHENLISTVKTFRIGWISLDWIKSWLTYKMQYILTTLKTKTNHYYKGQKVIRI